MIPLVEELLVALAVAFAAWLLWRRLRGALVAARSPARGLGCAGCPGCEAHPTASEPDPLGRQPVRLIPNPRQTRVGPGA